VIRRHPTRKDPILVTTAPAAATVTHRDLTQPVIDGGAPMTVETAWPANVVARYLTV
jgi:hypothetical protein